MPSSWTTMFTPIIVAIVAALGGAMMVFSGYDDAPGGVLLGLLMVVGAAAFGVHRARRDARTRHATV